MELGLWIPLWPLYLRRKEFLGCIFAIRFVLAFVLFRFIRVIIMFFWMIITFPIWFLLYWLDWCCHAKGAFKKEDMGTDEFGENE
jgi:hypothetical protein